MAAYFALASALAWSQDASVLLKRMQAALGNLNKVNDLQWTVSAKVWDATGREAGYVIREYRIIFPYEARKDQEMHLSQGKILHTLFYFDGKGGWGSFANMIAMADTPVEPLNGADLKMVRKEVRGFWFNLWRAQDREVSSCGPFTVQMIDKSATNDETDIELDPNSWLPRRSGRLCPGMQMQGINDQTEITEWITTDGIKVPSHILNRHAGQLVADIKTVEAKFDTGLNSKLIAKPPEAR